MDPAMVDALLVPAHLALLDELSGSAPQSPLVLAPRLRAQGLDSDLIAALQTQVTLRSLAQAKLGHLSGRMLFTRDGLEQATRWPLARLHAARFEAAGIRQVRDLTAGLGIDALAFALAGLQVTAIELDRTTARLCEHNLAPWTTARVLHGDGLDLPAGPAQGIYADPARRTAHGSRITDPARYLPPLPDVWAQRHRAELLGVKVGPGIPHRAIPSDAEAEWVSIDGDVVEAALWHHREMARDPRLPRHRAVVARSDPEDPLGAPLHTVALEGTPDGGGQAPALEALTDPAALGGYLIEPDGAIIRAHLLAELAARAEGIDSALGTIRLVSPQIAYLSAPAPLPMLSGVAVGTSYRVLDVLPLRVRKLKAYLRERDIGAVTIKKRGADVIPERLRQQLSLRGPGSATIVVTRVAGSHQAIIVEPIGGTTP